MIVLRLFFVMTMLVGVIYPLCVTGIAHVFFHEKARGSVLYDHGIPIGSRLIGQPFTTDRYFWPRPSATGYSPLPSGGSNLSVTSQKGREALYAGFLSEMRMASASGVDPHLTPAAIYAQVDRVAKARHLTDAQKQSLQALIRSQIEYPDFGLFGESRINVLSLNLALDHLQ